MIDISFSAVDRLVSTCGTLFAHIGNLADFAALSDVPRSVPAAYVIPLGETAEPLDLVGVSAQTHTATLGVVFIVRHAGDATGSKATLALQTLRNAVHNALVGWVPSVNEDALQFASGTLIELMDGGAVAWRDDFTISRRVVRPYS